MGPYSTELIFVNNQHDAQFFFMYVYFYSLHVSGLEELSKGENILKLIKGQRVSWLGHLERMEEDRIG